ncbi:DUF6241 domain-containing protein [Guptibacillus hwajinpoensis]|uniref:DUF6241 domain-containing protein n=1 Tax=Guptibacillus hwajinpoensis TaxID=208199 RepID=UPI001CFF0BA9|nr:DUF6241 domain-containing protein [Pseudalkalibacillus hwajinpoensis]
MEDKLKNLRRDMDGSVLKKGEVSEKEKERIYLKVVQKNKSQRYPIRIFPVFSISLCMILVLILSSPYLSNFYSLGQEENQVTIGDMDEKSRVDHVMSVDKSEVAEDEKEHLTKDIIIPPENEFMNNIYGMTNQKVFVESDPVYEVHEDYIEITDERIEYMLAILEKAKEKDQYQNYEFYYNTLSEWKKGNFENTVDVHNQIGEFNGRYGNKAIRLLTKDEEKEYIDKHFD